MTDTQAVYEFGGIFNFTLGIKDAKVFDVPPPCEVPYNEVIHQNKILADRFR